jgi:hypothetical protein
MRRAHRSSYIGGGFFFFFLAAGYRNIMGLFEMESDYSAHKLKKATRQLTS